MSLLYDQVEKYIEDNTLLKAGDHVGVAVSGGVDSMCLLALFQSLKSEYDLTLYALHFEHGIREKRSHLDAQFVKNYCKKHDISFLMESKDVVAYSKETKTSIETAARNSRYAFFEKCSKKLKLHSVALAHHMEDQAETILLSMIRGAGSKGIIGMTAYRNPNYIRPLLDVSKKDLMLFSKQNDIPFVTDETNFDISYSRNRIRQNVIVELENINENTVPNILRTSKIIAQDHDFINTFVSVEFEKRVTFIDEEVCVNLKKWDRIHIAIKRRIIRKAIDTYFSLVDVTFSHIDYIINNIDGKSGKWLDITNDLGVAISYDYLYILKKRSINNISYDLYLKKSVFNIDSFQFNTNICDTFEFSSDVAYFNMDMLTDCRFRYPKDGDFIYPLGMTNKKKLSDYLCDKKIPLHKRNKTLVLVSENEVVWVVGIGINNRFKVTKRLKNVFEIVYKKI